MAIQITVPRLGWSMDEGTFLGWLKKDGEPVKAGEPLFTLEGDKASQEIEATESGILRISPEAPKPGDTVAVGALLGYLAGEGESPASAGEVVQAERAKAETAAPSPNPGNACSQAAVSAPLQEKPEPPSSRITISPRARRQAAKLGLDYRGLKGSGRTGRIIEADVLAAKAGAGLSPMRRTIAERTAESFSTTPHFYLRTEIDAGALVELRQRLLPEIEQATGIRLTLTDLLLRAQALALRDCPFANAIWQDGRIVPLSACDVGVVTGLADGLLIPIVRQADRGDLAAVAKQRASLVESARAGKLTAMEMNGGATSLSNLGATRVDEFAAVIAAPQSSMLAVGRAIPRPFVVAGQLAVRTTLRLCLSVDHRVMDGGPAANFLGRIGELLEHPASLTAEDDRKEVNKT